MACNFIRYKQAYIFGHSIFSYPFASFYVYSWWRYQMETFSALLAICAGNSPVPGEFPAQRPVTRNFDVFFDLNKRLSKQWWGWWFETLSCSLWRHCNVFGFLVVSFPLLLWCGVWLLSIVFLCYLVFPLILFMLYATILRLLFFPILTLSWFFLFLSWWVSGFFPCIFHSVLSTPYCY